MAKDSELEGHLISAKRLAEELVRMIGYFPGSHDRTSAKQFAEDALAHIQKLLDEMEE